MSAVVAVQMNGSGLVSGPVGDVGVDPVDQGLDRGEGGPADRFAGDDGEPVPIWLSQLEPIGVE